jgi:hypothetical protein
MRVLAVVGLLVFGYLAIFPAGLFASTVDSACAGSGCDMSLAERLLLGVLYAGCFLALAATAVSFARCAISPQANGLVTVAPWLALSALAIGLVAFALLTLSYPVAGAALAALGALTFLWLRRLRGPTPPDPRGNGRPAGLNGHSP